jgi:hypothetical protein
MESEMFETNSADVVCLECDHMMSEHYDAVFCMVSNCVCKMHGGE